MTSDSPSEVFFIHSGMEIVYANPAFCTLIGAESQEQLIGMSLTDLVTPDYHSSLHKQVTRVESNDTPAFGLAIEFQTFTDRHQSVIAVSSLVKWDGTQQVQTSVFPIDSADSPAGRLLRDHAMDEAPIGITITDPSQPDNPIIYVNDGFCDLTGYSRDEILGQNCRFLQGDATREEPVAEMRAAIDAEEPVTVELRNYRKNGSMFWNRVTIVPMRSESGTVTHYLGYQQDISAEKRYEQDLTLFKEQAEGSDKAILITDPEGTIEYVNPAFERLTGYSAAEATGLNPRILKSGQQDEAFYAELWDQITAGEVWDAQLTNQTKHGELFEVKQKIIPVSDEQGDITHFVGIEQDITDKVLTEQTLDVLDRVLRHNLRNSLNVIDGHAELLEDEDLDPDARQASVSAIREQAAAMQKIAERTTDIRAIWDPTEEQQTWDQLDIETLIETYQTKYPDSGISVTIDGESSIQIPDADLFELALDEAVENAIEHTEQSSPKVEITVCRDPANDQVQITVADNGPGISKDERDVIESGEETPLNHSLGVGLWLMEWVATTLGGELTIADNEPQGTILTFQLPSSDRRNTSKGQMA
ncbi:PAS domain-containing protein [Halopenitus persicus]|uniref:PAS domain S-box-containing protein n=1 Tax=Halopenitus persicus TaxID=1048396 RepID=A0A1H3NT70_9EURY|nr:PAS domain-containing protein [Halopenitus persicus]SDY91998.1 PAS domain S-box-containing protein [Halopenitus persicus]